MQAVELQDTDIKALQVAQALSAEFYPAMKRWAKATLALIDGPSAFADRVKEAVVISGKLDKFLKGLSGTLPVVKVDGRGMGILVGPLSDALKALSASLKGKGVDDMVKALAVYMAWLDELAAAVSDLDEAVAEGMGRVAKAIPGGGVHAHGIRAGGNTETDGGHVHVLQLSENETALTGRDGEHSHDKRELEDSAPDGEHSHVFRLPDGTNLKVDASGEHTHEVDGETTTHGGVHFHEVEIDGKKIQTALPDTVFIAAKVEKAIGPWSQFGGSSQYATRIVKLFPEHKVYVEPFMGAASCLFTKERVVSEQEVLADLNKDSVFVMKFVQAWSDEKAKAVTKLGLKPHRKTYERAQKLTPETDAERFWKFIYLRTFGYNGMPPYAESKEQVHPNGIGLARYEKASERLKGVTILCQSYEKTMEQFDSEESFFFIDPPYRGEWNNRVSDVKGSDFDSDNLVARINKLKGSYIVAHGKSGGDGQSYKAVSGKHFSMMVLQGTSRVGSTSGGQEERKRLFIAGGKRVSKEAKETVEDEQDHVALSCRTIFGTDDDDVEWINDATVEKDPYPRKVDHVLVSYSGGKDSLASLIWAVKTFGAKRVVAIFMSTNEYPGMDKYVAQTTKKLGVKVQVLKAEMTYLQFITETKRGKGWRFDGPFCMYNSIKVSNLKAAHKEFIEQHEGERMLVIEGSRRDESPDRVDRPTSGIYFKKPNVRIYRPMIAKTEIDVWKIIRDAGFDAFWAYKEGTWRTGCWACPFQSQISVAIVRKFMPAQWKAWKAVEKVKGRLLAGDTKTHASLDLTADAGEKRLDKAREKMERKIAGEKARKRDTAEVNASGEGNLPELALDKVTSTDLKPAILRSPVVSLTGGIVNNGSTTNDIDVLIHGPVSTQLRRVIEFRLGRMFPSEINQRLSFHEDKLAGPFTDHIHLYDLALVPRDDRREIVRMSDIVKQDDPLMDWPKEPSKRQAVVQAHTRGKTLHLDVRFCMDGYLVGWTLFAGKAGLPDTNTVAQARELIRGYTTKDGNRYIKPLQVPSRVAATAKLRQPPVWLSIDEHVFEEGEIGATRNEVGIMIIMAKPTVQWGLQTEDYHEYFLEDSPVFAGQFFARFVVGTDSEVEETGAQGEKGFWTFAQSKEPFPSVLKQRAIESGNMPPFGRSALPESLEKVTPDEYRYWEAENETEASEVRAALVRARFFTPANVAMVDGELQRIIRKVFLYVPEPVEKMRGLWGSSAGKKNLATHILTKIPEHKIYVEPYAGGAAVFYRKEPSEKEVLCDTNPEIAFSFKFARDITEDQIAQLKKLNWTCTRAQAQKVHDLKPKNDVERFYRFTWKRWALFFNKDNQITAITPSNEGKTATLPDRLAEVKERLKGVIVRGGLASETIKEFDSKETFFYLDPPYKRFTQDVGEKEFDEEAFIAQLKTLKGKFFLHYDVKAKKRFEGHGWNVATKATTYTSSVAGAGQKARILEVTNYGKAKAEKSTIEKAMDHADGILAVHKTAEERYMLGVVLEPNDGTGDVPLDPDTQRDIYSADEIRQAAHLYMERHRNVGHMHRQVLSKAKVSILESYIAPVDFFILPNGEVSEKAGKDAQLVRKGTWLLALRIIDDELWKDVKTGKLNGLSIGGSARRIRTQKT